jgi:predicted RNA-binding protein
MCEANIYIRTPQDQEDTLGDLFLEAVDQIIPEGENLWRLTSIFGEQKMLAGRIHSMHLVDHKILFEEVGS